MGIDDLIQKYEKLSDSQILEKLAGYNETTSGGKLQHQAGQQVLNKRKDKRKNIINFFYFLISTLVAIGIAFFTFKK